MLFKTRLVSWISSGVTHNPVTLHRHLLSVLCLAGLMFTLLLPSVLVRVLVLAPILIHLGEMFEPQRAKIGLFVVPLFVTWHASGGVLTAALPNIISVGILESITGQSSVGPPGSWRYSRCRVS